MRGRQPKYNIYHGRRDSEQEELPSRYSMVNLTSRNFRTAPMMHTFGANYMNSERKLQSYMAGQMLGSPINQANKQKVPFKKDFKRGQKKPQKKQLNKDFTFKGELFTANDLFSESDCKKLKKLCANIVTETENIEIKYSKVKPTLIFEYQEGTQRKRIHFRDVVRGNKQKKIIVDYQLIFMAFDKLYSRVDEQFFEIGQFAMKLGEEKKLFKFKSIDIVKDRKDLKFFYSVGSQRFLSFILFNKDMFYIEFNTKFIDSHKQIMPKSYGIYTKFVDKVAPFNESESDMMAGEQIQSDQGQQQEIEEMEDQYEEEQTQQIKQKMKNIIEKSIEHYQRVLQIKNDELEELKSKQQKQERLLKISQEIGELYDNIQNYKQVRAHCQGVLLKSFANKNIKELTMSYKKLILAQRQMSSGLPVLNKKRDIFNLLNKNNLIIIEGQTGSGKSTQLPQILCQYFKVFQNQQSLPIIVTQPRKLATRTLAERVAFQMDQKLGQFVEYESSYNNKKISENSKIIFKLDRLLLDQLTVDPILSKYQCLVIDEAHERTISIDVILGRVKSILNLRPNFKVIITSASLDIELFRRYFNAPVLKIEGRLYPVVQIFKPFDSVKDTRQKVQKLILQQILEPDLSKPKKQYEGHILVFCSGIDEISSLVSLFERKLPANLFKLLSLHGRLTPQQQSQVFKQSKLYKVIFATRIAETSITINGVKVVIDPGYDREMVYDQKSKISSMQLRIISQSSAKQRAGRAGRTNNGFCFRLYTQDEKRKMQTNKTPEIQNMALDSVILRLKSLSIDDVINFPYISRPDPEGLKNSLQTMKIIGCLDKEEKITQIGELLVRIPIEPFLSRAIVQSIFFQIVLSQEEVWEQLKLESEEEKIKLQSTNLVKTCTKILVMLINSSSLYLVKQNEREDAEKNKFEQFTNLSGDFFLFEKIYSKFSQLFNGKQNEQLRVWANKNFLSLKALHQARQIESQIQIIIKRFNLNQKCFEKEIDHAASCIKQVTNTEDMILACLMSSFVSNLCLFSGEQSVGYILMSQSMPIGLYGSTIISLQGHCPKWIICYDLYTNQNNQAFCKVAQKIQFQLLKSVVNKEILQFFDIENAEKINPYYEVIKQKVPSVVFISILSDYRKKNSLIELSFLNKFTFIFKDEKSQIEIYYLISNFKGIGSKAEEQQLQEMKILCEDNKRKYRFSKNPKQIIEGYFQEIKQNFLKPFRIDYVGQISILLTDGSTVDQINFKKAEYLIKIICNDEYILDLLRSTCEGKYTKYEKKLVYEVEGQAKRQQIKKKVQLMQKLLSSRWLQYRLNDLEIKMYEQTVDKRNKIPKAKLILTFYAGTPSSRGHVFLNYKKHDSDEKQQNYLKSIVSKFNSSIQNLIRELHISKIVMAKKNTGINLYTVFDFDEIQIFDILNKLTKQNAFGYGFELPIGIIKFRDYEFPMCNYTDGDWEKQIRKLIAKAKIQAEDIVIKIWGIYKRGKMEHNLSLLQKNMRVNMNAELQSFSVSALDQFKRAYDKKMHVLGCGKLHIRFQYNQTVVATTSQIFNALAQDFYFLVDQLRNKYPNLHIQKSDLILFRSAYKIFINIKGDDRKQFVEPYKKINELFKPKQIKIQPQFWYIFDRNTQNHKSNILNKIQESEGYNVYFIFEKRTLTLKVFCDPFRLERIKTAILLKISQQTVKTECISYRGKGLKNIQNLIESINSKIAITNQNVKRIISEVNYQKREIKVTGDPISLLSLKEMINQLHSEPNQACKLCEEQKKQPFQLFNCDHSFCLLCLFNTIKQTSSNSIGCPECLTPMNIHDIKTILTEEQFYKICDKQVRLFVERNPSFHCCFSPDCEQIFQTEESKKNGSFQCELCGKWYCFTCKKEHKGFDCQMGIDFSVFQKLGIKRCPKCKTGIEKNKGCNHMTCKMCNAHICWVCLRYFRTQGECYDHLAQQCGGIFQPGYQQ